MEQLLVYIVTYRYISNVLLKLTFSCLRHTDKKAKAAYRRLHYHIIAQYLPTPHSVDTAV